LAGDGRLLELQRRRREVWQGVQFLAPGVTGASWGRGGKAKYLSQAGIHYGRQGLGGDNMEKRRTGRGLK